MIDYDFYVNSYLGTAIPEKSFPGAAVQAAMWLGRLRRQYRIADTDEMSVKMALCAMAETVYSFESRKAGVSMASVGGVSVRYEKNSLSRALLEKAGIYLDIYRGATK